MKTLELCFSSESFVLPLYLHTPNLSSARLLEQHCGTNRPAASTTDNIYSCSRAAFYREPFNERETFLAIVLLNVKKSFKAHFRNNSLLKYSVAEKRFYGDFTLILPIPIQLQL